MKTAMRVLFTCTLLIGLFISTSGQTKKEQKQKMKQELYLKTIKFIEKGEFRFEAEKAYPQGGSSIDLTTNYGFIDVSDDKSTADLPFFGRAYSVEYGKDGGINFEGEILERKLTRNDEKMKLTYTFKVKDNESFTVIMDIFSRKSASAIIRCESKSHISYSGKIVDLEKEDQTTK